MKIHIVPFNRQYGKPLVFEVDKDITIDKLRDKILERIIPVVSLETGTLTVEIRYLGDLLLPGKLSDHDIQDGAILSAEIREEKRV